MQAACAGADGDGGGGVGGGYGASTYWTLNVGALTCVTVTPKSSVSVVGVLCEMYCTALSALVTFCRRMAVSTLSPDCTDTCRLMCATVTPSNCAARLASKARSSKLAASVSMVNTVLSTG